MKIFEQNLERARKRVDSLDRGDLKRLGRPPGIYSLGEAIAALEAGLRHPKNGAAYDALVMLERMVYGKDFIK
jgi:exonuclease VII small subunit